MNWMTSAKKRVQKKLSKKKQEQQLRLTASSKLITSPRQVRVHHTNTKPLPQPYAEAHLGQPRRKPNINQKSTDVVYGYKQVPLPSGMAQEDAICYDVLQLMPLEEAMKYTHLLKKRATETNSYRRYQTPANPIELQYENTTHSPIEKKQRLKSMQEIINELDLSADENVANNKSKQCKVPPQPVPQSPPPLPPPPPPPESKKRQRQPDRDNKEADMYAFRFPQVQSSSSFTYPVPPNKSTSRHVSLSPESVDYPKLTAENLALSAEVAKAVIPRPLPQPVFVEKEKMRDPKVEHHRYHNKHTTIRRKEHDLIELDQSSDEHEDILYYNNGKQCDPTPFNQSLPSSSRSLMPQQLSVAQSLMNEVILEDNLDRGFVDDKVKDYSYLLEKWYMFEGSYGRQEKEMLKEQEKQKKIAKSAKKRSVPLASLGPDGEIDEEEIDIEDLFG